VAGWWAQRSLRARLTAAATLVIGVVVAAAAALLLWRVNTSVVSRLDSAVTREALTVSAVVRNAAHPVLPRGLSGSAVVQVVNRTGHVVASSPNIDGEGPLFTFKAPAGLAGVVVRTAGGVPVGEQGDFRVAATAVGGSTPYTVYVAEPLDQANQGATQLAVGLAVGAPTLAAVLSAVTWLLVGRALRPVDELLTGLDLSLHQQRQFIADAAHELRSPIASLLAQLEVAAGDGVSGAVRTDVAAEVSRLSRLVDDLLTLATLDAAPAAHRLLIDLDDLVFAELQRPRPRPDVVVDVRGVSAARVQGDPQMLTRMVRNLLDNAQRHARSRVEVSLFATGGDATFVVADDGPGIPAQRRSEVFDRFTRLDDARDRDAGGRGLGLAIVRDVVRDHHGSVTLEDNSPGARFVVRLPLVD
jgi:signal transduction histidine kinase